MTPDELTLYGETLYGPSWREALAFDLDHTSPRTVQRWAAGTKDIPEDLYEQLLDIAEDRLADIKEVFFKPATLSRQQGAD